MNSERKFKVGDKVLCTIPDGRLVYGNMYTVLGINDCNHLLLNDHEVAVQGGWFPARFVLATPLMEALL
jgi:hypothetical protein